MAEDLSGPPKYCSDVLDLPPLDPPVSIAGSEEPLHLYDSLLSANLSFPTASLPPEGQFEICPVCYEHISLASACSCWRLFSDNTNFAQSAPEAGQFLHNSHDIAASNDPHATEGLRSSGGRLGRKKKYQRLSKEAVTALRSWLYNHQDYPYPTKEEKDALQQQTGLHQAQISDWFSNARRRTWFGGSASQAVEQPAPAADHSLQSPMERWKNSPPDSEAAATSDIMRALDSIERPDDDEESAGTPASQYAWSSHSSSNSFVVGAPSTSTLGHSHSSGSEASLGHHTHYQPVQRPPTPMNGRRSLSGRRHRRRQKPPRPNDSQAHRQTREDRPYQCTFCTDSFRTKYDWERHEKTLHLPVDLWTCAPDGGIVVVDGTRTCVFCQAPDPETGHLLDRHNYFACQSRADGQRTFSRKDHLRQHLKLTHSAEYHSGIMDGWRASRTIVSRCGLCDATFATWKERVDHVGAHFKNDADMAEWKGDWGFAPDVQRLVENAMPPYLLGHERRTMDPWKSSVALLLGGSVPEQEDTLGFSYMSIGNDVPNALNRYTDLRRALIDYIHSQTAAGICPTDERLQQVARQFSYGGNDPLDQTYADYDPLWLEAVKQEAGLGTKPFVPETQ